MNSLAYTLATPVLRQESRTTSAYYRAADVKGYLDKMEQIAYESEANDTGLTEFRQAFLRYRNDPRYEQILHESAHGSELMQRYILDTLATIDYADIKNSEEQYTLQQLKIGSLSIQEAALGALTDWNNVSDVEPLKTITVKNYYLQKDLDDFVGRMENA